MFHIEFSQRWQLGKFLSFIILIKLTSETKSFYLTKNNLLLQLSALPATGLWMGHQSSPCRVPPRPLHFSHPGSTQAHRCFKLPFASDGRPKAHLSQVLAFSVLPMQAKETTGLPQGPLV